MPRQTMADFKVTLGENIYLKDRQRGAAPPDREAAPAGSRHQPAPVVVPPPPVVEHTTSEKAMSELNMLAELLGNIAEGVAKESGDDGFKLNLFNDTAMPDAMGAEVKSDKVKFDSKDSNKDLKDIASSMDLGGGGSASGGGDDDEMDDLLDLMDGV